MALPTEAIVEPLAPRRVLLFSATYGHRHGSIPIGKLALSRVGEATGAYETVISDDPANFEADTLKTFDAVILLNSTGALFKPDWKTKDQYPADVWQRYADDHQRLVGNLITYVKNGGGLVGVHAATDANYGHVEYRKTIGATFAGHPWWGHQNVTLVIEDSEHPIIKPVFDGMKDFQIQEEIFQFADKHYTRDRARVLLSLDVERSDEPKTEMKRKDNDYAVCWVQAIGKGRVFYTSLGHRPATYTNPMMLEHFLAGIQFATGDLKADTTPSNQVNKP